MEWKNTADVVIIGGGIIGVSTAYYLALNGVKDIVLIEKGTICGGSTGRCGAGIRAQWGTEMNCRLGIAALDIFEQLDRSWDVGRAQSGRLPARGFNEKKWRPSGRIELQNSLGSSRGR